MQMVTTIGLDGREDARRLGASGGDPGVDPTWQAPTVVSGFGNPCNRNKIPCSSQNNSQIA